MEILFDTANLESIKKYSQIYPFTGVTSNPSILKAEGKIEFFAHMREIRAIIGMERTLHIQTIAEDLDGILRDADAILKNVDSRVFIKIPTTEAGLQAIMKLKSQGVGVTATAIYSKIQGFMAIMAGADYIAPYRNRMENLDVNFAEAISAFRNGIEENHANYKILAASFKNIAQVNKALLAGAHTVTVPPQLLHSTFQMASVQKAIDDFRADWESVQDAKTIGEL